MRATGLVAAVLLCLAGCSDTGETSTDTGRPVSSAAEPADSTAASTVALPIIEQIDQAVAAVEAALGGPQQYFEINATARLVNLFVSLNDGAIAQPWLYFDGTATASEGQPATGGTFDAESMGFDPDVILATVRSEMPELTIESFYVHGDGQGNVLYGVLATSARGGGLDVVLGADGSIKSVDPV